VPDPPMTRRRPTATVRAQIMMPPIWTIVAPLRRSANVRYATSDIAGIRIVSKALIYRSVP
jgi:hypothetical protein